MSDVQPGGPFPMRTDRLVLRFVREEDVETLTAYRNDPDVNALQDWDLPYPESRARALVAAHEGLTDVAAGGHHQVAIELDGELVGDVYVGIHEQGGIAEIGFTLIPAAQGRGIAHEAVDALLAHLVGHHGIHRIQAELSKDNLASQRLIERLGMTFESLTRDSFWWRGAWDDNLNYSMTAQEWCDWRSRPRTPPTQIRLVEITDDNHLTYARVAVHTSQNRFVASVHNSYVDALFHGDRHGKPLIPILRGIEADGEPVGFLMYSENGPYLWRFLVDRRHQQRGIGRRVLTEWIEQMRADGHEWVETSWVPGKGSPEPLYRSVGFVPTGEIEEGEIVARLPLRSGRPR